jgi:hypothetical protein
MGRYGGFLELLDWLDEEELELLLVSAIAALANRDRTIREVKSLFMVG